MKRSRDSRTVRNGAGTLALAIVCVVGAVTSGACGGEPGAASTAPATGSRADGGRSGEDGGGAPALPFGDVHQGVATYYDATGAGACSFDPSPSDLDVAAMDAPEFAGSAVCGECVAVTGPKGAVTVRIVDLCPECEAGHLDLGAGAFAKVATPADGRVPIRWQAVPCPVTGNVSYHFKDGSNPDWTALQVRNHRLPIAKLEVEQAGGFVDVPRASYNYFVVAKGTGAGPVHVRITAVDGQALEDTLPAASSDVTVEGGAQLR